MDNESLLYAGELAWDPVKGDVILERIPVWPKLDNAPFTSRLRSNILIEICPFPEAGWAWGGSFKASQNLAANILDRLLPWRPGDTAWYAGVELPCQQLVVNLIPLFVREVIKPVPYWGATLQGDQLRDWLAPHVFAWTGQAVDLGEVQVRR